MVKRFRVVVLVLPLLLATVACTLLSGPGENRGQTVTLTPTRIALAVTPSPPTSTPGPTAIPLPTSTPVPLVIPTLAPSCNPRSDWPVYTVVRGDTLFSLAQRTGTTPQALADANCLADPNAITAGQQLRVPSAPPPPTIAACPPGTAWFFTPPPAGICPGLAETRRAAGEDFEGGRVYWYGASPASTDQRGTLYVIYNDRTWESYIDTFDSSRDPVSDPNVVPPAGRFQPMLGIGKLWRENTAVRGKLGWAFDQEKEFTGRIQSVNSRVGAPPPGYQPHFYIDHGKNSIVIRLYTIRSGPNPWEVAGTALATSGGDTSSPGSGWFFTFAAGKSPVGVPNPVETRLAAGQDFEGGRALYYAAAPGDLDPRGTVYVIYNNSTWETFVDTFDGNREQASDPNIVPPAGRYQPVRAIGKVWRQNVGVRSRLGWAFEPEKDFPGRLQTINTRAGAPPPGYIPHFYIDHGKNRLVLRLYSVDNAPNTWEVVGSY